MLYTKEVTGEVKEKSYIYGTGKLAEVAGSLDVAVTDTDGTVTGFTDDSSSYIVSDQIGSTRLLIKGTEVAWYSDYEPFGNNHNEQSVDDETTTDETFTTYTRDIETGLYYAMHRYYDPSLGRFISEDPAKDGNNWYVYTRNNPLRWVDPSGLLITVDEGDEWGEEGDTDIDEEEIDEFKDMLEEASGYEIKRDEKTGKLSLVELVDKDYVGTELKKKCKERSPKNGCHTEKMQKKNP